MRFLVPTSSCNVSDKTAAMAALSYLHLTWLARDGDLV